MRILLVLLFVVCATFPTTPAVCEIVSEIDADVQKIADPVLDNILAGFTAGSYQKYTKNFSQELKTALSEETFRDTQERINAKLGKYVSRQYLGFLSRDDMTLVLWKGRFEKMEADVLIKLTLSKNGRKNEVEGLYFE